MDAQVIYLSKAKSWCHHIVHEMHDFYLFSQFTSRVLFPDLDYIDHRSQWELRSRWERFFPKHYCPNHENLIFLLLIWLPENCRDLKNTPGGFASLAACKFSRLPKIQQSNMMWRKFCWVLDEFCKYHGTFPKLLGLVAAFLTLIRTLCARVLVSLGLF